MSKPARGLLVQDIPGVRRLFSQSPQLSVGQSQQVDPLADVLSTGRSRQSSRPV